MLLFKPFQKQDEFIEACLSGKYKYLLYGGAAGGGKSYVGLALLIFLCRVYPNSKWCVVRRDMTKIDQATIPTFNKLVPRSFLNKMVDNTAYFNNGSQIIFRGENYHYDKDLTWMDGFEVNGFLFEETQELQRKLFEKAKIRAGRHIIPNMPPILVIMTCNPSQNWSKDMFVKPWKEGKLQPPFFFLPSLTSDNSYLPEEYLENLKTLDSLTYQRYVLGDWDAIDVEKPFVYAFDPKKHVKKLPAPLKSLPIHLSFDFNIDPITCIAEQHNEKFIRIFKEFRLRNSNIYELCAKIRNELGGYYFYVTGDAAGNARSAMDRDNLTYYKIIQKELGLKNEQMKVPSHNPLISNNRVLVNSIFEHHPDISIDSECKFLIDDLLYVEVNHQGDIDKTKDKHRSHLLDCLRYDLQTFHFKWLKHRL